jgi:RNA polymerase sigma factor (sigma-70 family)
MPNDAGGPLLHQVRNMVAAHEARLSTDGQLLERFVRQRDEAAFATLVHRHAQVVWHVCLQVLGDVHDAEDAFQATFLILVRRAASIGRPERLGSWLYGVAWRVATRARKAACRRDARERHGGQALARPPESAGDAAVTDLPTCLVEELRNLPTKYHLPILLCYLEGRTNEEAARQLCWPLGTLKVRLMRGREMLRTRLMRRGLALSAGGVASTLANCADAAPLGLLDTAARAAGLYTAGSRIGTNVLFPRAIALTDGVLRTMWHKKVSALAAGLLVLGSLGAGVGWRAARTGAEQPTGPSMETAAGGRVPDPQPAPNPADGSNPAQPPAKERTPPGGDRPAPGGDGVIARERFSRAYVDAIKGSHAWCFKGKRFILAGGDEDIPADLVRALLGPDRKASRIVGEWDLDRDGSHLLLTSVSAGGKPGVKEVKLGISPAGLLRVNLENGGQYNVMAFEARLPTPKGVQFPIYEFANKIDREFLQGTWAVDAREAGGKTAEADALKGAKVVVKGDTIAVSSPAGESRGTFWLDAASTPGTLDVTFTDGPEKGNKYVGVYEVDGDRWRFCRTVDSSRRPKEFVIRADRGDILETLRRVAEGE